MEVLPEKSTLNRRVLAVPRQDGTTGFRYANLRSLERKPGRHTVMARKTRQGKPPSASHNAATKQAADIRPGFFLRTKLLLRGRPQSYFHDHGLPTDY